MPKKRLHLTVDERVLLHLANFSNMEADIESPFALTQQGIADSIFVLRSAVPRSLKGLEKKGFVSESLSHVRNTSRRRKAYFLTLEGRIHINDLLEKINEKKITLRLEDGTTHTTKIKEVCRILSKKYSILDMINALSEDNVISAQLLSAPKIPPEEGEEEGGSSENGEDEDGGGEDEEEAEEVKPKAGKKGRQTPGEPAGPGKGTKGKPVGHGPAGLVERIKNAPSPHMFQGRTEEIDLIKEALEAIACKIIVLHGIAGIGKTTLASKVLESQKGRANLFWLRLHKWDQPRNVLSPLAEFLADMGKPELRERLNSADFNISDAAGILQSDLDGANAILFFDDFHTVSEDVRNLFVMMREALEAIEGTKMVLTQRHLVKFYDRREVLVKKLVKEIELKGLDQESSYRLLKGRGVSEGDLKVIFDRTKGHPLSLELVESGSGAIDLGNFSVYLEEEVYSNLKEPEKAAMSAVSIFRYPASKDAVLGIDPSISRSDLDRLVSHSLLTENAGLLDIHDVLRDFFACRLTQNQARSYNLAAARCYSESIAELKKRLPSLASGAGTDLSKYTHTYERLLTNALEVQHHLLEAKRPEEAVGYLVEYGQKLLTHGFGQNVLDMYGGLKHDPLEPLLASKFLEMIGDCQNRLGQWNASRRSYEDALSLLGGKEEWGATSRLYRKMGVLREKEDDLAGAASMFEASLDSATATCDARLLAEANGALGWLYWKTGDFPHAFQHLETCIENALSHPELPGQAKIHIRNGMGLCKDGDMDRAITEFEKCLEVLNRNRDLDFEDSLFSALQDNYLKAIFSHYVQLRALEG